MTQIQFDSLIAGKSLKIEVDGDPVCVTRVGDEVFATSNICSHAYAELSDGEVKGFVIECWLHGADFDLRTGKALTLPAIEPIETYRVERDENQLTISRKTEEL
jgi:3-phenylpropionate/trans-cinnamate dioxygenase ferredoxin subunit